MDLSFNISGAGPLSQISAHIISFDAAVHLATGAIGWWKAQERSQSLTQSLSACKASLVSTSAFSVGSYRERRNTGVVQGLGVQEGILRKFPAGVESTAVSQHPGIDCLRALTTGLLCFYNVPLTCTILADIIPFGLLQPDQEDEFPTFDGPLLASLKDWVKAVAAEEDCNNIRNQLLHRASLFQSQLTGFHGFHPHPEGENHELGLLLGCLRWMITPIHRRGMNKYPTRSLGVWTTAAIMCELAFSISVSLKAVYSKEDYMDVVTAAGDSYPDVVIVAASVGKTDPWMVSGAPSAPIELRPRVFPILSIPYAAFCHLQKQCNKVNAKDLTDIWKVAFRYANDAVKPPTLSRGGKVRLDVVSSGYEVVRESHKHLIGTWSPHLARILRPALDDYVPTMLDHDWSPAAIKGFYERRNNGEMIAFEETELINNVYTLTAIILGTVYGACSRSLIPMAANPDEKLGIESLELAFSPDSISNHKIFGWASDFGQALGGLLDSSRWTALLLELATGIDHPQRLDEKPTAGKAGKLYKVVANTDVQVLHVRVSDIFGAQANGVFAVSDFVVQPSTCADSSLAFHVGTGRILNLPVNEEGYLLASPSKTPTSELHLDRGPELEVLRRQSESTAVPQLRMDVEPHWAEDEKTVCLTVRSRGVVVAILNIGDFLKKLMISSVSCSCTNPAVEVRVERADRWRIVTIHQLLHRNSLNVSTCAAFIHDPNRILVDAQGDDTCRAFAAGTLSCRRMAICKECVLCAYKNATEKRPSSTGSVALIIG